MRTLKFRAWDGQKMFYNGFYLTATGDTMVGAKELRADLMQYTGLKDKNGKEIYEGDVLDTPASYNSNAKVLWSKENACFKVRFYNHIQSRIKKMLIRRDFVKHCTVVGNIYDNPELLTNNNK